jgi:hypothetical protein
MKVITKTQLIRKTRVTIQDPDVAQSWAASAEVQGGRGANTLAPPQHSHLTTLPIFYMYSCMASPCSFSSHVSSSPVPKHLFIVKYRPWGTCRRRGEVVDGWVGSAEHRGFSRTLGCAALGAARRGCLPEVGNSLAKAVVVPWRSSWVRPNPLCSADPDQALQGCLMRHLWQFVYL